MFLDDVRAITSEEEYDAALKAVEPYFDDEPDPGTPEAARFDGLFALIEQYEAKHYSFSDPSPAAVVREVMSANGYTREDLVEVVGSKARASEILSGKREVTLRQVKQLRQAWGIPADALIGALKAS